MYFLEEALTKNKTYMKMFIFKHLKNNTKKGNYCFLNFYRYSFYLSVWSLLPWLLYFLTKDSKTSQCLINFIASLSSTFGETILSNGTSMQVFGFKCMRSSTITNFQTLWIIPKSDIKDSAFTTFSSILEIVSALKVRRNVTFFTEAIGKRVANLNRDKYFF